MNLQVENLEKNLAKLTITVASKDFDQAIKESFKKNKSKFNVPGFRKGHATLNMIEKFYGIGPLLDDAINYAIDHSYPEAAKESALDIVSRPEISITKVGKGEDLVYEATVAVYPEVTLGEYKGIEVKKAQEEVTEADIENALKVEQNKNARMITVEDRPIQEGDETIIDFDGYMDDIRFEGGKGEDYSLTIGSKSFIAGFEEQIIGHQIGDAFDINVSFPEDYHVKDLAGKPAVFKVEIKDAKYKELPELDDDFASEISELDTLEEYKKDLKEKLAVAKQKRAEADNENTAIALVSANAQVDIPDQMLEPYIDQSVNDYARNMQNQGFTLEQFMEYTGTTMEQVREQMKPQAFDKVRTRLVLEAIVKAENITVEDADIEKEFTRMAESYKMEVDKVKEYFKDNALAKLKEDISLQKAVNFIVDNAKFVA